MVNTVKPTQNQKKVDWASHLMYPAWEQKQGWTASPLLQCDNTMEQVTVKAKSAESIEHFDSAVWETLVLQRNTCYETLVLVYKNYYIFIFSVIF
jgi:hypothetical protein